MPAMAKQERETHKMKLLNTAQYEIIKKNWHKFMSGPLLTWEEFIAETEEEQDKFFRWFCKQYNDTFTIPLETPKGDNNMKNTQGPWYAKATAGDHSQAIIASESTGETVAVVYNADRDMNILSAAPELLYCVEECLKIVNEYRRLSGGDGDVAAANARRVIAKAKGE